MHCQCNKTSTSENEILIMNILGFLIENWLGTRQVFFPITCNWSQSNLMCFLIVEVGVLVLNSYNYALSLCVWSISRQQKIWTDTKECILKKVTVETVHFVPNWLLLSLQKKNPILHRQWVWLISAYLGHYVQIEPTSTYLSRYPNKDLDITGRL